MRVLILGGTGTIGAALTRSLLDRGDSVSILTRDLSRACQKPGLEQVSWVVGDPREPGAWQDSVGLAEIVVNLVGHNLFADRWNDRVKREIRESRVLPTTNLAAAILRAPQPPAVLVQGSAIGFYGDGGDELLTEESPAGAGFLPDLCQDWENAARPVLERGTRLPLLRTGVVLTRGSGALGTMEPLFKWVPGGAAPVGGRSSFLPATGRQWMSWVHLDDLVGLILLAIDNPEAAGPLNGTAPNPVTNADFSRQLAAALNRPFLPIGPPNALLRLLLGEVASTVIESQRVFPKAAGRLGYPFRFPVLVSALTDLYGTKAG